MTSCTRLYRNKQLTDEQTTLQKFHVDEAEAPDTMQFKEELSTAETLSNTYQSVGTGSILFDIMQSQLSENVLPVTSQHLAVGQHCIDMLLQKDAVAAGAGSPKKRAPPKASGKSKSPGAKKGQ